MASLSKNFDFNLRRDHQKNFLWASRLWVGRQKEPILGYVPKKYEKKNSVSKGLNKVSGIEPSSTTATFFGTIKSLILATDGNVAVFWFKCFGTFRRVCTADLASIWISLTIFTNTHLRIEVAMAIPWRRPPLCPSQQQVPLLDF